MRGALTGRGLPNALSVLQTRAGLAAPTPPGAA
jgi:hypothetical protein